MVDSRHIDINEMHFKNFVWIKKCDGEIERWLVSRHLWWILGYKYSSLIEIQYLDPITNERLDYD